MTTTNYLKDAILEYISKNNEKLDLVDITSHFKISVDIVLNQVQNLKEEGKIKRVLIDRRYFYKITR